MHFATTAIELDVEGRHHHHFARADNIGQRRVDLGVDVLELHVLDCLPGFAQIDEGLLQHHAYHPQLGRCELTALDLGVTAIATKEIVDQLEYQPRIQDEQRGAAQRLHLHQIETGGHVQGVHVLAELHHLHPAHGHIDRKSTRLNSSHVKISYAVFCLK